MGMVLTLEQINQLAANSNIRRVSSKRIELTFEFRTKLFQEWEKDSCLDAIRRVFSDNGIDPEIVGDRFILKQMSSFKRYGKPTDRKHSDSSKPSQKPKQEHKAELLETGYFKVQGNRLFMSPELILEILEKYPEQSIEETLQQTGIDPQLMGRQRIRALEKKMNDVGALVRLCAQSDPRTYDEEEILHINQHPYVRRVTSKTIYFHSCLYREASILEEGGCTINRILEIYEIPEEWLNASDRILLKYQIQHSYKEAPGINRETLEPAQMEQYFRIQAKRTDAMEQIIREQIAWIREILPRLKKVERREVCKWIQSWPKQKRGEWSLSGVLKQAGISRSNYYHIIGDEHYAEREIQKEQELSEDMERVLSIYKYEGFTKGARQISMQSKALTGKYLGRKKVTSLMKMLGIRCPVRGPNPARRSTRKHIASHLKPNLVRRRFKLYLPGQVTLTDVTYLKYDHGRKLAYASATIDSVTGKITAMNLSMFNDLELVLETLRLQPSPEDARKDMERILHSDQGVLYLTDEYQELVKELGYSQSMSKRGNCQDNAPIESYWSNFKAESRYESARSFKELTQMVRKYQDYYNNIRGQWNRKKMTPVEFEDWLLNLSDAEYGRWKQEQEEKYLDMKEKARKNAVERAKNLGV